MAADWENDWSNGCAKLLEIAASFEDLVEVLEEEYLYADVFEIAHDELIGAW